MQTLLGRMALVLLLPYQALILLGGGVVRWWERATYLLGVVAAVLTLAVMPSSWPRTVRNVFARQMLFTGVDSMFFTMRISIAVGVMVIVQAQLLLSTIAQSDLLGTVLMRVIVRELAPLLANFVVIVRSATAMGTEMANMRREGEVDVLDAQGLDPMIYLVMPRMLATALTVFCLAVVIVAVSFFSGFLMSSLLGAASGGAERFVNNVVNSAQFRDLYFFFPKTLVTGLFIGAISCVEGLSVRGAATEIPQVAGRSAVASLTVVSAVTASLSLIIYGTILSIEVF